MGNTLPAIACTVKWVIEYTLLARDDNETWRYPRLDLRQERQELAMDVAAVLEVVQDRLSKLHDQARKIGGRVLEIVERLLSILYRMWRAVYHVFHMVDEVVAELVEMLHRVPRVLLELLERSREYGRM